MNESESEESGAISGSAAEATDPRNAPGSGEGRRWHSAPEVDDESVRAGTGRDWSEWRDLLDAWPGHSDGHAAIAKHVQASYEIGDWWAQTVTVGYERITGLRLPYQQSDGTFSISRSRKLAIDSGVLRERLLDDSARSELFPGHVTQLRSKPTAKTIRIQIGPGVAGISLRPIDDETTKISVEHKHLRDAADAPKWQEYWSTWLEDLSGPDVSAWLVDSGSGSVVVPEREIPRLTARQVRETLEQERR